MTRLGYAEAYRAVSRHAGRLIDAASPPTPRTLEVLDAGAGTGAFALAFAGSLARPCEMTLVDQSAEMLAEARRHLQHAGLCARYVVEDVAAMPATASRDVVLCGHVIEHADDPERVLSTLRAVLVPGGWLVLACSHPHWCTHLLQLKWHHAALSERRAIDALERAGFDAVEVFRFTEGPPSRTSRAYLARRPAASLPAAHGSP